MMNYPCGVRADTSTAWSASVLSPALGPFLCRHRSAVGIRARCQMIPIQRSRGGAVLRPVNAPSKPVCANAPPENREQHKNQDPALAPVACSSACSSKQTGLQAWLIAPACRVPAPADVSRDAPLAQQPSVDNAPLVTSPCLKVQKWGPCVLEFEEEFQRFPAARAA